MSPSIFESIRHVNEHEQEYWSARELYRIFEYTEYGKFLPTIEKAKTACKNSGQDSQDHFADVSDMVSIGSDAKREVSDYRLSRYACYLVIQNADPTKKTVAEWQTYFAIQTHRQELSDHLLADKRRVELREDHYNEILLNDPIYKDYLRNNQFGNSYSETAIRRFVDEFEYVKTMRDILVYEDKTLWVFYKRVLNEYWRMLAKIRIFMILQERKIKEAFLDFVILHIKWSKFLCNTPPSHPSLPHSSRIVMSTSESSDGGGG